MPEAAAAPTAAAPTAPPTQGNGAAGHETPAGTPVPAETKAAPPAPPKTYRLKISGTEREVSEQTYHAYAQKAAAADQMLAEAKRAREEAASEKEALKQRLGKDWRGVLKEMGHDPDEFLKRSILETYGQPELTPEQKQVQVERQARERAEAELARFQQERLTAQQQAEEQAEFESYRDTFNKALTAAGFPTDTESPMTAWAVRRMAALAEANMDAGTELSPEVMAEMVKADMADEHRAVFGSLEGDALLDALGDEVVRKVNKAALARFERRRAGGEQTGNPAAATADPRTTAAPPRAVAVNVPRDPESGKFKSREQMRAESPFRTAFIPASVTGGR